MKPTILAIALALIVGCTPTGEPQPPTTTTPGAPPAVTAEPGPPTEPRTPAPAEASTVPERFQGEWNSTPADCGTANNPSRLRIGADDIRFHESSGTITSVTVSDESDITLVADMTGEGEVFESTHAFELSDDGNTLTDTSSGIGMVRHRCE
ncbi:hypothetical protein [Lysobacter sp. F6437]|uniref:hypothetical protein n=1 Tax=Lysobacter sp. F6437 TaxID=3459296 RepID=UPI00403D94C6